MSDPLPDFTLLRAAADAGDGDAREQLERLAYEQLRRMAHTALAGESRRGELQTTLLANDALWKRFCNGPPPPDSKAFFAFATRTMRQLLVDNARRNRRRKRGGGWKRVELEHVTLSFETDPDQRLALEEALKHLREVDPVAVCVVECRHMLGLSVEETAKALDISTRLVVTKWQCAKLFLARELRQPEQDEI